jgi:hypothetical protein
MQCFCIPFKPLGVRKMSQKTVSYSNTTDDKDDDKENEV